MAAAPPADVAVPTDALDPAYPSTTCAITLIDVRDPGPPPAAAALPGNDPDRIYRVRPQPPGPRRTDGTAAGGYAALPWWAPEGVRMSGRALGAAGVPHPGRVVPLRATAVDQPDAKSGQEAVIRG
jgi:hypothetical protein